MRVYIRLCCRYPLIHQTITAGVKRFELILLFHSANRNVYLHLDWESIFNQRPWSSWQNAGLHKCNLCLLCQALFNMFQVFYFIRLQPTWQPVSVREGNEPDAFWSALGGKTEYTKAKEIKGHVEDPHLFLLNITEGRQEVCSSRFFPLQIIWFFLVQNRMA